MFSQPSQQENALEARGINPQTELPDNVTLSGDATSVRFHSSKKTGGYVKKEVDEYILNVIAPSLDWFKTALETRDQEVYRLGLEIEDLERSVSALTRDVESANMNNMLLSSRKANEDDKEMAALMEQNVELRRRLDELSANPNVADAGDYEGLIETYKDNEIAYQQHIDELNKYVSQIEEQLKAGAAGGDSSEELKEALDKCALMEKDLETFQTYVDEIQVYTNSLEERVASLEAELAAAQAATADSSDLARKVQEAETAALEHSRKAEELLVQVQDVTSELEQKNSELAEYARTVEELNGKLSAGAENSEYEEAYNQLSSQYSEAVEQYNSTVAEYEQRVEALNGELGEAVERANEYYEHYIALQGQIGSMPTGNDSSDSLIKERNVELSAQLDQTQAELEETQKNYAALYEAYEELTQSLPESGIVSMEEYASIKVAYDEAVAETETLKNENSALQKEVAAHSEGLLGKGISLENFNTMKEDLEKAKYDNSELQLKYNTLLSKKEAAQPASSDSDEITYSEEEYLAIYSHATEATEQYNELVSVHEELRQAYEELFEAVQAGEYSHAEGEEAPQPETPAPSGLPVTPQIKPALAEPAQPESKYKEKKLPEGITLEDLE